MNIPSIDVGTIDAEKTRWLDLGGVRFLIRLATPVQVEAFRRHLRQRGIARGTTMADFEIADESRFRVEFATAFVRDWSGAIQPEGTAYTPELMAKVMGAIPGLGERLLREVSEYESFLSENGSRPTTS